MAGHSFILSITKQWILHRILRKRNLFELPNCNLLVLTSSAWKNGDRWLRAGAENKKKPNNEDKICIPDLQQVSVLYIYENVLQKDESSWFSTTKNQIIYLVSVLISCILHTPVSRSSKPFMRSGLGNVKKFSPIGHFKFAEALTV